MTFTISDAEHYLLQKQNTRPYKYNLVLDDDEIFMEQPASLGHHGYTRHVKLSPGIELSIFNWRCDRDLILQLPGGESPIEMLILNSGYFPDNGIYPTIGGKRACFRGSGIIPTNPVKLSDGEQLMGVGIYFKPEVFRSFFPDLNFDSTFGKQMIKSDDWAESFFPRVTPSIWASVRQIIHVPYRGATRKLYLQAKVLELLAIQLDPIMAEFNCLSVESSLKPLNIDRVYHARDILAASLENPPSILELAQQVGISDRTLRRGFKEIFDTTIIGYLTQKRLEKAKRLLREGIPLDEASSLVGYRNLSHFAAAFKKEFGITPSECKKGKLERLSK